MDESHWQRLEDLDARAASLLRRLESLEARLPGRYALVLEVDDLELLIDPRLLRGPPRVTVRRGTREIEVWLDDDGARPSKPGPFTRFEERRILSLVDERLEELTSAWFDLREDRRRGRMEKRHVFVD